MNPGIGRNTQGSLHVSQGPWNPVETAQTSTRTNSSRTPGTSKDLTSTELPQNKDSWSLTGHPSQGLLETLEGPLETVQGALEPPDAWKLLNISLKLMTPGIRPDLNCPRMTSAFSRTP